MPSACRSFRKRSLTELSPAKMRCVWFASGVVRRGSTSRTRLTSDKGFPAECQTENVGNNVWASTFIASRGNPATRSSFRQIITSRKIPQKTKRSQRRSSFIERERRRPRGAATKAAAKEKLGRPRAKRVQDYKTTNSIDSPRSYRAQSGRVHHGTGVRLRKRRQKRS